MEWCQVLEDPVLAELPYQIELNEWGKIEMSPASNLHGMLQTAIAFALMQALPNGKAFVECSIRTAKNVKVADAVWGSKAFFAQHGIVTPFTAAPEIVVEVVSPGNTAEELLIKKELYFEQGAAEVWLCDAGGNLRFYSRERELDSSLLCSSFPRRVEI